MKVGNLNDPGDLVQLKRLCGDYGLSRTAATANPLNTSPGECESEACSAACIAICAACAISV
ncbi:MAG: hypothetical protein NTZ26_03240 [Candidatus Aminicenantes bacterium]|nr:hypothetical protein [Candidatus Aminicenantes bacterium]